MYIQVFKNNRNVIYYLLGAGISGMGNHLSRLGFLFLTYEITQSGLYTTWIALAEVLPHLVFGLIGGVFADWADRKRLIIRLELLRIILTLSLVVSHHFGFLEFWQLLSVSFFQQVLGSFYMPGHRALLPLITKEEERTAVNSLLDSTTRGMAVLGPAFGAGLMRVFDTIHFFTLDAISHIISAALIYALRLPDANQKRDPEPRKKIRAIFASILEFFHWSKGQRRIRILFMTTTIIVFLNTWVWQVGLLLQWLQSDPKGEAKYSLLLGWYGAGVIAVNLLIPLIVKELTMKTYLLGSLIWGAGIFMLGFVRTLPMYVIAVFTVAIGYPIAGLARVFLLQKYIPADKLGRGFSFNAFLLYLSNTLSFGVFGAASSFVSTRILFVFCGSMMLAGSTVYFLAISRKRRGVIPYRRLKS